MTTFFSIPKFLEPYRLFSKYNTLNAPLCFYLVFIYLKRKSLPNLAESRVNDDVSFSPNQIVETQLI